MLILASNSPRRKELITEHITSDFLIIPSNVDEKYDESKSIEDNILNISYLKGMDVFKNHLDDIIISADTMVIFNNKVYGKPKDNAEAKRMLTEFSNNEHKVITAYHIFSKNNHISKIVTSYVKFKPLSEAFIDKYILEDSPLDKAGSYGIQDPMMNGQIEYYKGSLTNIIGLPVEELKKDLEGLKY